MCVTLYSVYVTLGIACNTSTFPVKTLPASQVRAHEQLAAFFLHSSVLHILNLVKRAFNWYRLLPPAGQEWIADGYFLSKKNLNPNTGCENNLQKERTDKKITYTFSSFHFSRSQFPQNASK